MKITKQQLKQLIKEEIFKLEEVGYLETEEDLKDWTSGFTGDPNDPLPSTVAKRSADLEAAKTLVKAMELDELEQLEQYISDILAEPGAPSSDWDEDTPPLDPEDTMSEPDEAGDVDIGDALASPGLNPKMDHLRRVAANTRGTGK